MKRQKKGSLRRREIIAGYLMIAPLMAGVIVFFIGAFFSERLLQLYKQVQFRNT